MSGVSKAGRALYKQAKAEAGNPKVCLSIMQQAYATDPCKKYMDTIMHLKQIIAQSESDSDSESSEDIILLSTKKTGKETATDHSIESLTHAVAGVSVADPSPSERPEKSSMFKEVAGVRIRTSVYSRLYGYQIDGLAFLLRLFNEREAGCILADDMGLGKTIQTIVLLSSLMELEKIKSVLIVAPSTLLVNWGKEFKKWYPDIDLYSYHEGNKDKKLRNLHSVQRMGGVLFTTFGLLQNHVQYLRTYKNQEFVWDFVVLDEAHKIKNPTKTTRAVSEIPSYFNLAITGTPVQNNLKELWTIYNWVMRGELLGGYTQFRDRYETPITNARKKDATDLQKKRGTLLAEDLRKQYAPFFLRRTKDEVMGKRKSLSGGSGLQALPSKFDWVVWVTLTEEQISMYKQYLQSKGVKTAMREKKNALTKLVDLKKICDSPFLLSQNVIKTLRMMTRREANQMDSSRLDAMLDEEEGELVSIDELDVETLMSNTAKLVFLVQLLENLRSNGHRTLVFSQSTRMLDIIQKVLQERKFKMARLDGRVKNKDRDRIITTFQESNTIDVCLLSTGVGSVGLTLTNADRVVIYDPSWNPGSDAQAIDRAYRIGQIKSVVVYRLITCATVEEKIFIRQVFKNSVIKQMVQSEHDPTRYFDSQDIRDLLEFENPLTCKTYHQIEEMHGHQKTPCPETDAHRQEVTLLPHCYNVSNHDLLFSITTEEIVLDDDEEQKVISNVQETRQQLDSETSGIRMIQAGKFVRPFDLPVAEGGIRVRRQDHDEMINPTELDHSIVIETINESEIFDGPTVQIDDSDLLEMPVLHGKSPKHCDDAVDPDDLSCDDESLDLDNETGASNDEMEHNYSSSQPQTPREMSAAPSGSDDMATMANCTASGSESIIRKGGRKLRIIRSDSESSSNGGRRSVEGVDDAADSDIVSDDGAADPNVVDGETDVSDDDLQRNYSSLPHFPHRVSAAHPESGENRTADDSELITRRGGRKVLLIDTDSDTSSTNDRRVANGDGGEDTEVESDSADSPIPFQSNSDEVISKSAKTSVAIALTSQDTNQTQVDDLLSDDSCASTEFSDDMPSLKNFNSLPSQFHSTAVNFDPMNSPVTPVSGPSDRSKVHDKSTYFTPAARPLRTVPNSADQTIIISDVESEDDERVSPLLDESFSPTEKVSDPQLSLHLSRLSIPVYDHTNHALDQPERKSSAIVDYSPCDSSDGSSSPIEDTSSVPRFHLRPSLFITPSPPQMDISDRRPVISEAKVSCQGQHDLISSPLPDERSESPIFEVNTTALLLSPRSTQSPGVSIDQMSNITLRKRRRKSRLGNGILSPATCALDFDKDDPRPE